MESVNNQPPKNMSAVETKNNVSKNQFIYFFAVLMLVLGFVGSIFLRDFRFLDRFLFEMAYKNGLNPTILVLIISAILLAGSLYFFRQRKKSHPYYLIPASLLFSLGLSILGMWISNHGQIKFSQLDPEQREQYLIISKENEGFSYICKAQGKRTDGGKGDKTDTFYIFVKVIGGKRYYYCSRIFRWSKEDYLVEKYDNKHGIASGYIIDFDFDWDHLYVTDSTPGTNEAGSKTTRSTEDIEIKRNNNDEPQTIIVEHQRQPVPVQEWVPCGTCYGTKRCQVCGGNGWLYNSRSSSGQADCYNCNGSKECPACGGRGGHYETYYR